MKVVQINTFPYKATGNIMLQIHRLLQDLGHESYVVWGRGRKPDNMYEFSIGDRVGMGIHGVITRVFDRTGFASWHATKRLLSYLEEIKPDIIHLHNIHGYYLNIKMLFDYLNSHNEIQVVWTIHDCWPITGHCAYFSAIQCNKWKTGCHKCPQKNTYPKSWMLDASKINWIQKKRCFEKRDIQLVTPSKWLKTILMESFLQNNNIEVIYNGLDLDVFKPVNDRKNNRKYILGVASEWTERKGLRDFVELRKYLDRTYDIILIGLTEKQIKELPNGIIGLKRTENVAELVSYYSGAEVFVNLSVEETMGMTTVEALACGTPVIVYNTTALPEVVDQNAGIIIDKIHDVEAVAEAIVRISKGNYDNCRRSVTQYENKKQFLKYVTLYKRVCGE